MAAAAKGHAKTVGKLLEKFQAQDAATLINAQDQSGKTALMEAEAAGHAETVAQLEKGLASSWRRSSGRTA